MPARKSTIPKYCLHKPSGHAYCRIHGRVVYLGVYDSPDSKEEYGRRIAELAANPVAPAGRVTSSITIIEIADAYWQFAQGYYRKPDGTPSGWLQHIRLVLTKHLCPLYGRTPACEFGPKAFKAVRQVLVDAGHSRQYINKLMPVVKQAFKWAASEEMIPGSVYHSLCTVNGLRRGRTVARETKPILPVADELVDATLPHMPRVVADMVRFQRLVGCRPGEVCQLRPCDIDTTGDVWIFRPESHKTQHHGRGRTIYIGPKAQAILRPYLERDPGAHCFSPAESEAQRHEDQRTKRKTKVQPSQRNRRKTKSKRQPWTSYGRASYGRAINRAVEKANRARTAEAADMGIEPILLPHWHANQLRHSRATEVRQKYGLEAAQVILGHARADVTQTYAERDAALAMEVSRKIG